MVVTLGIWDAPLIAQTQIESELRAHFKVVLKIKCRLPRFIRHIWLDIDEARWIPVSNQQVRKGISRRRIRGRNSRDVLWKIKLARRIVGPAEIIEELRLLKSASKVVLSMNPGNRRRV